MGTTTRLKIATLLASFLAAQVVSFLSGRMVEVGSQVMAEEMNAIAELRKEMLAMQAEQDKKHALAQAEQGRALALAQAQIVALREQLARQSGEVSPLAVVDGRGSGSSVRSRRDVLKKAGLGAAMTAAGVTAMSRPAAAADGDSIILGSESNTSSTATLVTTSSAAGANGFTFEDAPGQYGAGANFPSTLAAYKSAQSGVDNAFFAYTEHRDDSDSSSGHAIVAWSNGTARSNLLLVGGTPDPTTSSISRRQGELVLDTDEDLWLCVESGTPGTWRKLAGPQTSGSMHAISPKRVWDTRFQGGAMTNGESRTISVADGRVLGSSAVDVPGVVPSGATAIAFNLAVVSTGAAGFLSVTPGGATDFGAASINWSQANSVLNNGTMSTVDSSRQVTVWCSGTTDFVIDVTGYYL